VIGCVTAFYLFDVAQEIRLPDLRAVLGDRVSDATLADKTPGQPRLHYIQPPLVADGAAFDCAELDGFRVRCKFYGYGVVSLMLTRDFSGTWSDLTALGQDLIESEPLELHATSACRAIVARIGVALTGARAEWLQEDYLVFAVTALDAPASGVEVLDAHGADIAQLLRGERQPLSAQERDEVLRHRMSYLADDLIVPAWNAAFVLDTAAAVPLTLEILEFANSQLLEFRYHDEQLEGQLTRAYAELQQPRLLDRWTGRRHRREARRLQAVLIEVNELTDHAENVLKFVGDIYAARLFTQVSARLQLDKWKRNVQEKLKTLDDIYRFAVEQTGMAQANILELAIVVIMIVELWFLMAGIMK
jgi:hypothetical protein